MAPRIIYSTRVWTGGLDGLSFDAWSHRPGATENALMCAPVLCAESLMCAPVIHVARVLDDVSPAWPWLLRRRSFQSPMLVFRRVDASRRIFSTLSSQPTEANVWSSRIRDVFGSSSMGNVFGSVPQSARWQIEYCLALPNFPSECDKSPSRHPSSGHIDSEVPKHEVLPSKDGVSDFYELRKYPEQVAAETVQGCGSKFPSNPNAVASVVETLQLANYTTQLCAIFGVATTALSQWRN